MKHVAKVHDSLKARLRAAVRTGKMSTKRLKESIKMGGEMRPDWDDGEGGAGGAGAADDDSDDDFDIDSHEPEELIGGMEGRLTNLVLQHTAVMAAEVETLKARLDAKMDSDAAFQRSLLEQISKKK